MKSFISSIVAIFCFVVVPFTHGEEQRNCLAETPLPEGVLEKFTKSQPAGSEWGPSVRTGVWTTIDVCQTLIVLSTDKKKADIIYAYGEGEYDAGYEEVRADIMNGGTKLTFKTSWGASITYEMSGTSTYRHGNISGVGEIHPIETGSTFAAE